MSESAIPSSAAQWRPKPAYEWDTSDRVPEMAPAEITFGEFLSALNPLQHIPIVGSIYRELTGDELHPAARVIGGALIGGPIGLVASAFNAIIEQATGKDLAGQAIALLMPGKDTEPTAAVASAAPAPETPGEPVSVADAAPAMPTSVDELANVAPAAGAPTTPRGPDSKEPQGRSLAYYQSHAGQRLPNSGNMTNQRTALTATPNPTLQRQTLPTPAPVASPVAADAAHDPTSATNEPADVWFVNAMMQGLDRYRDAKRLQRSAPQIDVSH